MSEAIIAECNLADGSSRWFMPRVALSVHPSVRPQLNVTTRDGAVFPVSAAAVANSGRCRL